MIGLHGLATQEVYPFAQLLIRTVGSYPTFSPLPRGAVIFCGTFCRVAPTTDFQCLVLCVVRTFLPAYMGRATEPTARQI